MQKGLKRKIVLVCTAVMLLVSTTAYGASYYFHLTMGVKESSSLARKQNSKQYASVTVSTLEDPVGGPKPGFRVRDSAGNEVTDFVVKSWSLQSFTIPYTIDEGYNGASYRLHAQLSSSSGSSTASGTIGGTWSP